MDKKTMKKIRAIKKSVLERIKPGKREERELSSFSTMLKEVANTYLERFGGEALICGSTGKGTWLRGDHDIDLFLVMPKDYNLENALEIAKRIVDDIKGKYEISYAQHPYLKAKAGKYRIDIVPCHKIEIGEKIISAVDRSPLHLRFVLENLDSRMRDEVRIAKKFLKAINAYGSDLRRRGLSGYVVEVLISKFRTFENLLEFFSSMKFGERVSPGRDAGKKFPHPLVVIDPVDPERNTAAALSVENFSRIREMSRRFLDNPSLSFFEEKGLLTRGERALLERRGTRLFALKYSNPGKVEDIQYPQLRKIGRKIRSALEARGINVVSFFEHCSEKCYIVLEVVESGIRKIPGPEAKNRFHARRFSAKHSLLCEWKGRLFSCELIGIKKELERAALSTQENGFKFLGFSNIGGLMKSAEFCRAMRSALFLDMLAQ